VFRAERHSAPILTIPSNKVRLWEGVSPLAARPATLLPLITYYGEALHLPVGK